jgi:uncharacterized protein (DUF427 family)
MWNYTGKQRPEFAREPAEGQESVWDYPRPPKVVEDKRHVVVRAGGQIIADTHNAWRVLETASAPSFYLPPEDVNETLLKRASGTSFCEWKGQARYWDVILPENAGKTSNISRAVWSYHQPSERFSPIDGYYSFYPALVECFVDGERVTPQPGGFYGGWITNEIVGPVKGEPGTGGW